MDVVVEEPESRIGTIIRGKWKLERLLGVGDMSWVYAARHQNNGTTAAVKLMHPNLRDRTDLALRLKREGYYANKLDHPSTVRVIDDDVDEQGVPFLVMELLDGHTLERYIGGKERLPVEKVIQIGDQILDVLSKAHAEGVLHRDINPANLMLCEGSRVKVLDFGVARMGERTDGATLQTQTGVGLGNPSYVAPEQARGRWDLVDVRTDLFAVAATMYALISGDRPRAPKKGNEELLSAMTESIRPLREVVKDVDAAVAAILDRSLTMDMNERFESAEEMQNALRAARASIVPPPPPSRAPRSVTPPPPPPPPAPPKRAAGAVPAPPPPAQPRVYEVPAVPTLRSTFASPVNRLTVAFDPRLGFLLVGPHEPPGAAASLRCVDMHKRAVVWDALTGDEALRSLLDIRVIGRLVLFAQRSSLACVDLGTGQLRYTVPLGDRADTRKHGDLRGPIIVEGPGTLVAKSAVGNLVSFDPETGRERAKRQLGPTLTAVPTGTGPVVARYNAQNRGVMEVLDPSTLQPMAIFGKAWFNDEASVEYVRGFGTTLVAYVDHWGLLNARGVLVVDLPSRQKVLFEREQNLDADLQPALGQSCVYYTSLDGMLYRAPGGRVPAPQGQRFLAVQTAGPALLCALGDGRGYARVIALDAMALTPRFDCGYVQMLAPSSPLPARDPSRFFQAIQSIGFVIAADGSPDGELRAFDIASGAMLWRRALSDVGPLDDWHPLGSCLVLRSALGILVIDPTSGATVAAYAPET
jgi:serine/threonine-protein kinase